MWKKTRRKKKQEEKKTRKKNKMKKNKKLFLPIMISHPKWLYLHGNGRNKHSVVSCVWLRIKGPRCPHPPLHAQKTIRCKHSFNRCLDINFAKKIKKEKKGKKKISISKQGKKKKEKKRIHNNTTLLFFIYLTQHMFTAINTCHLSHWTQIYFMLCSGIKMTFCTTFQSTIYNSSRTKIVHVRI